jgi:sugar phosphate isomerase/epimerase
MDRREPTWSSPWPLAVHGLMLRGVASQEAVELIARAGYSAVHCQLPATAEIHDLSDLRDHVTTTCVGFAPDDRNPVSPEHAAEVAESLHASNVRVCGASMVGQSYQAAFEATLRTCEAFSRAARKRGQRILLHQRWGTVTASASQMHRVLERFDPGEVGCIYDPGSMTLEGYEEYRVGLEILGSYVADVHVANTRHFPSAGDTVWQWEWSPLSDGLIDLLRLARALRRANYRGWITLADRCPGPSAAALLQADRRMLQQAFDDLEGIGSHNPSRPRDDHVDLAERAIRDIHSAAPGPPAEDAIGIGVGGLNR